MEAIRSPGFIGLFESETVTPDVSRRKALDFDVDQMLKDAKLGVRESIVRNLNLLGEQGFVTDKIEFLARCVAYYGREVALESNLRWINVARPPGEVNLLSCKELLQKLAQAKRVLIGYGTGPWTAMRRWSLPSVKLQSDDVAIILDDTRMDHLYSTEKRVGALIEIWSQCEKSSLFGTLIGLLGEAWQAAPTELIRQDGWELNSAQLYGEFR